MSLRKSTLEKIREAKRRKQEPIQLNLEGLLKLMLAGREPDPKKRVINSTQKAFIYDPFRYKAYMGAAGVAKTSTGVAAGLLRALFQPGSKGLVARHDYNDLMDTTLGRAEEMLSYLPNGTLVHRDMKPPAKWWIQPVLEGEPSQITFMGLKDNKGSYDFNWAFLDEADEIEENAALLVDSRLRTPGGNYSLMLAFNPPAKEHWLYTACTGLDFQDRPVRDPLFRLFRPIPGENDANLPPDYHANLAKSLPEDLRMRLVAGEWGATFPGSPVFREFKYAMHVRDNLKYDKNETLYRFWDFGYRHPYVCFAQLDDYGRLRVLREFKGQDMEIGPYAMLVKTMGEKWFPDHEKRGGFVDFGDPAARQKKDTGSTLVELGKAGIALKWRITTIEAGLREIRVLLERLIVGEPILQFDRAGCPILISAMRGGYHLDDSGKPKKDGYYDHPADAFRYGIMNVFTGGNSSTYGNLPDSIEYSGD